MTQNYHNIWLRSVNTLTPQIKYIYSYDHMGRMIVNFSNKKCENKNNSTEHLNHIYIYIFLNSILYTPENGVSNDGSKLDKIKVRTSSINSSSKIFYFLLC